jgi:hypothetical protein
VIDGKEARPRGRALLIAAAALLVIAALAGSDAVAGNARGIPGEGLDPSVQKILKDLDQVGEDVEKGSTVVPKAVKEAKALKEKLFRVGKTDAFDAEILGGSCKFSTIYGQLETLDSLIAQAGEAARIKEKLRTEDARAEANMDKRRKAALKQASKDAREIDKDLATCSDNDSSIKDATSQLRTITETLEDADELDPAKYGKAEKKAQKQKKEILEGHFLFGCDIYQYYAALEQIDLNLEVAAVTEDAFLRSSISEQLEGDIQKRAKASRKGVIKLEKFLKLIPCGTVASAVDVEPSWFHVNGFGNPPSYECAFISTSPALVGAAVSDVITKPGNTQVTKTATTDANGAAVISESISVTGTYKHDVTVTPAGGGTPVQGTAEQTVGSAQTGDHGQCPAPAQ